MNTIMKLSSPMASKMITVILCGFLVINGMFSMRNLEIRSFFAAAELIEQNPMLLEVITATRLNDIIIESFFCDFGDNKSSLPLAGENDNKGNSPSSANSSMAVVVSAMNLILTALSSGADKNAQLDNKVDQGAVPGLSGRYAEPRIADAREWLKNAADAVSSLRKALAAIDLPRGSGVEDTIVFNTFSTRPLL